MSTIYLHSLCLVLGVLCLLPDQEPQPTDALKAEIEKNGGRVTPGFTEVYLVGDRVNDEMLRRLIPYQDIRLINLKDTSVTGPGIRGLVFFRHLKTVHLSDNEMRIGGLKNLLFVKTLSGLAVTSDMLTDDYLSDISKLTWLSTVNIILKGANNVTTKGLLNLATMKSLTALTIKGGPARVSDENLAALSSIETLEYLSLYPTSVTDKGILALSRLKRLKTLNLYESAVTDAGLEVFAGMSELKTIALHLSKVTPNAVAIMKMKAPQVRTFYAPSR